MLATVSNINIVVATLIAKDFLVVIILISIVEVDFDTFRWQRG